MIKDVVKLLACPACGQSFSLSVFREEGHRVTDGLLSDANGHAFPVVNGVPRLLPKSLEAHTEWRARWQQLLDAPTSAVAFSAQDPATVASFGFQWNWDNSPRTQDDLNYRVFQKCKIEPIFLKGKKVLDAGCGAGLQTRAMAEHADQVVGIDLSDAVNAASRNVQHLPNVTIVQCDIAHPALAEKSFDFVYSEGVLHHTENPAASFRALVRLVRKNGTIAAGFYGKRETGITPFLLFREPLRMLFGLLPSRAVWIITALSVPLNYIPVLKHVFRKTIILYDPRNPSPRATWCLNYDFYGTHKYQYYLKPSDVKGLWFDGSLGLSSHVETAPGFYRAVKTT